MPYANHLASQGVVALAFDKRGSGASTGDWTDASLEDLAADARAAMTFLATRDDVDPRRIGIWGVSQAGWVIPLLATGTPSPAFAIVVTGGGASPREIEMYGYRRTLDQARISGDDRARAEALLDRYFAWLATGRGRDTLAADLDRDEAEPWASLLHLDRIMPSEAARPKWAWVATFDPAASIATMRMPTLVMLGGGDPLGPADLSAQRWRAALAKAGNRRADVRVFADMGHAGRQGTEHNPGNPLSPSYLTTVEDFLRQNGLVSSGQR